MEPVSGKISSAPAGIAGTPIAVGWAGIGETGGQRTGRVCATRLATVVGMIIIGLDSRV